MPSSSGAGDSLGSTRSQERGSGGSADSRSHSVSPPPTATATSQATAANRHPRTPSHPRLDVHYGPRAAPRPVSRAGRLCAFAGLVLWVVIEGAALVRDAWSRGAR